MIAYICNNCWEVKKWFLDQSNVIQHYWTSLYLVSLLSTEVFAAELIEMNFSKS